MRDVICNWRGCSVSLDDIGCPTCGKHGYGFHDPPDWRPIETAPMDGTEVLVWKPGWETAQQVRYTYGQWRDNGPGHFASPTHWQPLPDPPETPDA